MKNCYHGQQIFQKNVENQRKNKTVKRRSKFSQGTRYLPLTFKKRNVPLLYLFIEKYCKSEIKALKSFAEGLKRDIGAIENAVAYDYNNGFVEGTNSQLKMIKRTMYGRCIKCLLEVKLRYVGNYRNG